MAFSSSIQARAMVLAAGRGERMRPLTDTCPKPLLAVRGKALLQWHLDALQRDGVGPVLINTAWLGEQIEAQVVAPQGTPQGAPLLFSHEGRDFGGALETAGGIVRALPQLAPVFWVLAGDVYAPDFQFAAQAEQRFAASTDLAHIWLVPNPAHNLKGDFGLTAQGRAVDVPTPHAMGPSHDLSHDPSLGQAMAGAPASARPQEDRPSRYTYSTIGLYRKALFAPPWCDIAEGNPLGVKAALAPLLRKAMAQDRVSAALYTGAWTDVGTPERLQQLNA